MAIGSFEVLRRVHALGDELFPRQRPGRLKQRLRLLWIALTHFREVRKWYGISDNPWLTQALRRFPIMHGAIYIPYINCRWPLARRLATIDQHYRMLGGPTAVIARATLEEVELASFNEEYAGLRLILDKAAWFSREGEIVLNLFVGDQRFYSAAFTLASEGGQPMILLGALQGSNVEDAKQAYRDMTHALHGMRPRDLLLVALKLLARQFGIERIWAISSAARHKVQADYDQIWQEHDGQLLDNGFFEIPAVVRYRPMAEIISRKRSIYRRRYAMLDRLSADLAAACAAASPVSSAPGPQPAAAMPLAHGAIIAVQH